MFEKPNISTNKCLTIDYKSFVKKVEFALDKTKFCLVSVKASCTCVVFIKRYSHNVTGPN